MTMFRFSAQVSGANPKPDITNENQSVLTGRRHVAFQRPNDFDKSYPSGFVAAIVRVAGRTYAGRAGSDSG